MNEDIPLTEPTSDDQLVAYLDGELENEAARALERRLAEDPELNARMHNLQRTWDLLDRLQRTEADDEFTRSTVEMVALRAAEDVKTDNLAIRRNQGLQWAALAAVALLAVAAGFGVVQYRLTQPQRELVRDLPVIENVDEYRNVESMDFLQRLQKEGLFAAEVDHGM